MEGYCNWKKRRLMSVVPLNEERQRKSNLNVQQTLKRLPAALVTVFKQRFHPHVSPYYLPF